MARRPGRKVDYTWLNFGAQVLGRDLGSGEGFYGSTGLSVGITGTVMRVRGKVAVTLDAGAADEKAMILVGLQIVNADTFAAGTAPEISTDSSDEASWLWQGELYVSSGAEAAVVAASQLVDIIDVDSKAMRKLKANDVIALVGQSPAILVSDQGGTWDLSYFVHVLFGD